MGHLKCDHIKRLLTLTSDYIKRSALDKCTNFREILEAHCLKIIRIRYSLESFLELTRNVRLVGFGRLLWPALDSSGIGLINRLLQWTVKEMSRKIALKKHVLLKRQKADRFNLIGNKTLPGIYFTCWLYFFSNEKHRAKNSGWTDCKAKYFLNFITFLSLSQTNRPTSNFKLT